MEGIFLGVFMYAAIPALFSCVTMIRKGWHGTAAFLWAVITTMRFIPYGLVPVLIGIAVAIGHAWLWLQERKDVGEDLARRSGG